MQDRLAALGGRLNVVSALGEGTSVQGHLPVAWTAAASSFVAVLAGSEAAADDLNPFTVTLRR
jgi:signal transduction histidine kinase